MSETQNTKSPQDSNSKESINLVHSNDKENSQSIHKSEDKQEKDKSILSKLITSNNQFKQLYTIINSPANANTLESQQHDEKFFPTHSKLMRMLSSPLVVQDIKQFTKVNIPNPQTKNKYKELINEIASLDRQKNIMKKNSERKKYIKKEPIIKKKNVLRPIKINQTEIVPKKDKEKLFNSLKLNLNDWKSLDNIKKDNFYTRRSKEVKHLVTNTNGREIKNFTFSPYKQYVNTTSLTTNPYQEELQNFSERLNNDKIISNCHKKMRTSIFDEKKYKYNNSNYFPKKQKMDKKWIEQLIHWD